MPSGIEERLAKLGRSLPAAAAPAANYVPWAVSRGMVWIAGQLPLRDGKPTLTGKLGQGVTIEAAQEAAAVCALNVLAQLKSACAGDLGKVARCVKLVGFVNSTPGFAEHHKVVNGASDLIVAAMAEAGRHARSAVGVAGLPFDAAVEVEAVFELA